MRGNLKQLVKPGVCTEGYGHADCSSCISDLVVLLKSFNIVARDMRLLEFIADEMDVNSSVLINLKETVNELMNDEDEERDTYTQWILKERLSEQSS